MLLLLDGLSAVGPVTERCCRCGWHYLIVPQDTCLPQVWEEYRGLRELSDPEEQHRQAMGGSAAGVWLGERHLLPLGSQPTQQPPVSG